MVFGLKQRGSKEDAGGMFSFRKGRSLTSCASTTDPASYCEVSHLTSQGLSSVVERSVTDNSVAKPDNKAKPEAKPEETEAQEVKPEARDLLGSSLDPELGEAFRLELDDMKTEGINAVDHAEEAHSSINNAINAGQLALEDENAIRATNLHREEEALKLLAEHRNCLEKLRSDLEAQAAASRDKVVRGRTTSKKFEIELAVAEEAVKAARAKADVARLKRAENVTTNIAAVAEADDRVATMKVQMAAATERHRTREASLALMRTRTAELHGKMAACEREKDFALEAMESLSKEKDWATDAKQNASDLYASSVAALKVHVEDSERRILGHEAELRRCQARLQAAKKLQDLRSRPALHDGDCLSLEKARSNATFAADQAAVAVEAEREALKATKDVDVARTLELTAAVEKVALSLSLRDLAVEAVAVRYAGRKSAAFNTRALHSAAIAEHDAVSEEIELVEKGVADLQEAKAACALQVEDAMCQAADALRKVATEEMPLKHAEQAEAIVVKSREQEMANIRRALHDARHGAKEAEADVLLLSASPFDVPAVSAGCGMAISEMEVCLQEKEITVQQAQIVREAVLPSSFSASDTLEDLAEEANATSAFVSARAELEAARAFPAVQSRVEPHAVIQMKMADLVQVEIADAALCQQNHSLTLAHLQADKANASEQWDATRDALKADLHRAEMGLRVAREDLKHNDGVREMFKECREGWMLIPFSSNASTVKTRPSNTILRSHGA